MNVELLRNAVRLNKTGMPFELVSQILTVVGC
jgi:hypothetical protein